MYHLEADIAFFKIVYSTKLYTRLLFLNKLFFLNGLSQRLQEVLASVQIVTI